MHRANFIFSLIALALFSYAQARGYDPLSFLDGDKPVKSTSSARSTYHK